MEIIFLLLLTLEGGNLAHLEMHSYHLLPDEVRRGVTCEEFLRSADLQRYVSQGRPAGQTLRAACLGGQRLAGATVEDLVGRSAGWAQVTTGAARKEETLRGVLRRRAGYDETVKSVASYLGQEFSLETSDQRLLGLWPSKEVPVERLRGLKDRPVVLRAVLEDRTPPDDTRMQVPVGMGSKPMQRVGYRVLEIIKPPAAPKR